MDFRRSISSFFIAAALSASLACGGGAKKVVVSEEMRDGRDRELYAQGLQELKKRKYEQGRLLLNTMISTYDGSPLLPLAKLLIADSFYREGGTSNLNQAEAEYREWFQFFPQSPLADDVLLKIAEIHVRQIGPANQDISEARRAERELLKIAREYPQSTLNPQVQDYLKFVREQLGMHELGIARLAFRNKQINGVLIRTTNIIKNYPEFTYMDEALYLNGVSQVEKEDTPKAAEAFARIVREYPKSEYRDKSAEYLERFQIEVPEPKEGVVEKDVIRKSFIKRKFEEVFGASTDVSKEGILLRKDDTVNAEVAEILNKAGVPSETITPESQRTGVKGIAQTYGQVTSSDAEVKSDDKKKKEKEKKAKKRKDDDAAESQKE
jgi:outer membrane protein assembly factor BamD